MAGIAGGLGGGVMVAKESTYGTWVTPTRAIEVHDSKLQQRRQDPQQGTGLAYGRSVDLQTRRVTPWFDGGGTIDLEVLSSGHALLLAAAMGSTTGLTQIGTTPAYKMIADYGVPDYGASPQVGSFSLQNLVPDTGGNIKQQNFHGCKITKAQWECERTGLLMASYDIDAQQAEQTNAAQTPTYTSTSGFSGANMLLNAGAFGSEAALDGVTKVTITLTRALNLKRIYAGDANKQEPTTIGVSQIAVALDIDLLPTNKATVWDLLNSQVPLPSLVVTWTGPAIGSSGSNNTFTLNPTNLSVNDNGTPELDGPDTTKATINMTGLIDSANDSPLIATLITGDTGF